MLINLKSPSLVLVVISSMWWFEIVRSHRRW